MAGCIVGIYEVERCYGGPEEGGWWYDWYTLSDFVCCSNNATAKKVCEHLRAGIENESLSSCRGFECLPDNDDNHIPIGFSGSARNIEVFVEEEVGESATRERPHYE